MGEKAMTPQEFDGIFQDELEEAYQVPRQEALFDLQEMLEENSRPDSGQREREPARQPLAPEPSEREPGAPSGQEPQEFEELCRGAGIDPQVLGELIQEGYFERVLEGARRESEQRMLRSLGEDTPERRRYEERLKNGMTSREALGFARQEQLEQKVRQLEQQLRNRERAIGSLQSQTNPSWEFE